MSSTVSDSTTPVFKAPLPVSANKPSSSLSNPSRIPVLRGRPSSSRLQPTVVESSSDESDEQESVDEDEEDDGDDDDEHIGSTGLGGKIASEPSFQQARSEAPVLHVVPVAAEPYPKPIKKGPFAKFNSKSQGFSSPTDKLMSPATQKIEAQRHRLAQTIKPRNLGNELALAQAGGDGDDDDE
ncbi:uncharacterized protein BJ171DRAFT_606377 [Polychytrium aggregatum]|uniref:uncharacterized protein n=1 Tax=Polychytrium aggregatum TaxID=110093 RepID=UPI0022FDCA13|nr:uncharacterized protein BJ171DRAFT_606377 [Polychytrium aggregatum]KAI9190772.1 hypothetical protein BJ171DRAFT_606377 [Polychytrium aggregatum]